MTFPVVVEGWIAVNVDGEVQHLMHPLCPDGFPVVTLGPRDSSVPKPLIPRRVRVTIELLEDIR